MRFDHVAIEIREFDERIRSLTEHCGMRLLRRGLRTSTGQRIAMVGDSAGTKIEFIEAAQAEGDGDDGTHADHATFAHIAFRVDDAQSAVEEVDAAGWETKRPIHRLDAAKADTAMMADESGLTVQFISYDDDSPDMVTWDDDDVGGEGGTG